MDWAQRFAIFHQDAKPSRPVRQLIDASCKLFLNNGIYIFIYTWGNREVMLHPWGMGDDR
jgi:hypothetical protein